MTYAGCTLILQVGLTSGPFTALGSVTWTDLSDRLISFDSSRGRQDRTVEFEPGTATMVLDNSDRMLDPDYGSSLVYRGADKGLPLCPVRVRAVTATSDKVLFHGLLGPEGWPVTRGATGVSKDSVCVVQAVERTSWMASLGLPSSPWAYGIQAGASGATVPVRWIRGDAAKSVLVEPEQLPCTINDAVSAKVSDTGTGHTVSLASSLVPNDSNPAMQCQAGARVKIASADLPGTWPSTQHVASCVWSGAAYAADQNIMWLYGTTGNNRWQVYCATTGTIVIKMWSGGGTLLSTANAPVNPADSGGRWDTGSPVHVTVKFVGSTRLRLYVNGVGTSITASVPASYGTADLICVGSSACTVDEIMWWDDTAIPSDAAILTMAGWFTASAAPGNDDTLPTRVAALVALTGWTTGYAVHRLAADPTLWGVGSVVANPGTFGEALDQLAESYGGVWHGLADASFRIRTAGALNTPASVVSGDATANYVTPVMHLTDEAAPAGSPVPVRRQPIEKTGVRLERVVNQSTVSFGQNTGLGVPTSDNVTVTSKNAASITRYGTRPSDRVTQVKDGDYAATMATSGALTAATPGVDLRDVTIMVWGSDAATEAVIALELENMVKVTDTPPVGAPWTANLNVQGISHSWSRFGEWTCTLSLAESGGYHPTGRGSGKAGAVSSGGVAQAAGIADGAIGLSKLSGAVKALLPGATGGGITALTGDVTGIGSGSVATSIAAGAVAATELADTIAKGLDFASTASPFGIRLLQTGAFTSSTTRTANDFGICASVDFDITGVNATWMTATPTGGYADGPRGPAGLFQAQGTVKMTADIGVLGQGVAFQNFLTYRNATSNEGSAFATSWGFINNPRHLADTTSITFHPELGMTTVPIGGFWDGPMFETATGGTLYGDTVDAQGFTSELFSTAGVYLAKRTGIYIDDAYGATVTTAAAAMSGKVVTTPSDIATFTVASAGSFASSGSFTVQTGLSTTAAAAMNTKVVTTPADIATFTVASTTGFRPAGQFTVVTSTGSAVIAYTAVTGTTFTGCTLYSGTGTLSTGAAVTGSNVAVIAYTGKTSTTFTTCTLTSGTGSIATGAAVSKVGIIREQTGIRIAPLVSGVTNTAILYGSSPDDTSYIFKVSDGGTVSNHVDISTYGASYQGYAHATTPVFQLVRTQGTQAVPTSVTAGLSLGRLSFKGYESTGGYSASADANAIQAFAAQDWTASNQGIYLSFGQVLRDATTKAETFRMGTHTGAVGMEWDGTTGAPTINLYSGGTVTAPAQSPSLGALGGMAWVGYTNSSARSGSAASITVVATAAFTSTSNPGAISLATTKPGTTTTLGTATLIYPSTGLAVPQIRTPAISLGDGTTTMPGAATVPLTNAGASTLAGAVTMGASLGVTGDTSITGNLYAVGGLFGDVAAASVLYLRGGFSGAGQVVSPDRFTVGGASGRVAAADTGNVATLFSLSSTATNDDPIMNFAQVKSTTVNTALKTIGKVAFTAGSAIGIVAYVVGHRSDTAESMVFYELAAGFKASTLNGATPVQVGTTVTRAISTDASVTVAPTLTVVSSEIAFQVKLNATENWSWAVAEIRSFPLDL